jgi:hypothetical protein
LEPTWFEFGKKEAQVSLRMPKQCHNRSFATRPLFWKARGTITQKRHKIASILISRLSVVTFMRSILGKSLLIERPDIRIVDVGIDPLRCRRAQVVESSSQRLSDPHQSHFAGGHGKPRAASRSPNTYRQEDHPTAGGAPKASMMFQKGVQLNASQDSVAWQLRAADVTLSLCREGLTNVG